MPLTTITNPNLFAAGTTGTTVQLDANFATLFTQTNSLNTYANYFADTGVANAYVVAAVTGLTYTLAAGAMVQFKATNTNTAGSTLNVFATGVKSILNGGVALSAAEIQTGQIYWVMYDGTNYELLTNTPNVALWTPADGSGAALSLTVVADGCYFIKSGKLVTTFLDFSYPATADATTAKISGLPFTSYNNTNPNAEGIFYNTGLSAVVFAIVDVNATTFTFKSVTGAVLTNTQFGSVTLRGIIQYRAK